MLDERLKKAILKALDLDEFDLTEATFAYEVPGWDSLSHVAVLCEVEREFSIRFRGAEVVSLENVGDLDRLVRSKLEAARAG